MPQIFLFWYYKTMLHGVIPIALFAFVLNLPFGYLRGGSRKFSIPWFLYIHLPIPFVVFLRVKAGLGIKVIPLLLASAFLGQLLGGKAFQSLKVGRGT